MTFDLLLVGVICLVIEGVAPGIGIFGFVGTVSLLWALFLALGGGTTALAIVAMVVVLLCILIWVLLSYFPQSTLGKALTLHSRSTADKGYTGVDIRTDLLHEKGVALTTLRPAGTVAFGEHHIDVVAEGSFVEAGTMVEVISVTGGRIVVRPC